MLRRTFVAVLACLALAITGCGDSTGSGASSRAGTYTLRTVNGGTLPYTFVLSNGVMIRFTEGQTTLNGDGTFGISLTYEIRPITYIDKYTDDGTGTYTVTNGAVRLNRADLEDDYTGTLSRNTLTLMIQGDAFVFIR